MREVWRVVYQLGYHPRHLTVCFQVQYYWTAASPENRKKSWRRRTTRSKSPPLKSFVYSAARNTPRVDEESDRTLEAAPSEADDEDCASISSLATVASQPVTEVCHRDRTMSLFSSFRLNFPGKKKKSKRGAPLFHEKEPENSRFSSPDLMREKLDAARSQAELSKSSQSVRNAKDSVSSIPGDFLSLEELRIENSTSFHQLNHAQAKGAQEYGKLAKSVSFSDCQAPLSSKQVICTYAKTLGIANGHTERTMKPSGKQCFPHPTEAERASKSTFDGNDSLRLPTEPSVSKQTSKLRATNGYMCSRAQNCDGTLQDHFGMHGTTSNGDPKFIRADDKPAVISSEKSCNGRVSHGPVQTTSESNASHTVIPIPSESLLAHKSQTPAVSKENFTSVFISKDAPSPSCSTSSDSSPIADKSPSSEGDNSEALPLPTKHSSFEWPNHSFSKDTYPVEVSTKDSAHHTLEKSLDGDPQLAILALDHSEDEQLRDKDQKICESKTDCTEKYHFSHNAKLLGHVESMHFEKASETHPDSVSKELCSKPIILESFKQGSLPTSEKRDNHDLCVHNHELNIDKNEKCSESFKKFGVCANDNQDNILENLCFSNIPPSTNEEVCVHKNHLIGDKSFSCELTEESGEKCNILIDNVQNLLVCTSKNENVVLENSSPSSKSPFSSKILHLESDDDMHSVPCDIFNKTSISLPKPCVAAEDINPFHISSDDTILAKSSDPFIDILNLNYNNIINDNRDILSFLKRINDDSEHVNALCGPYTRTSVLNLNCLDNLNNNSLFDVKSYLLKLVDDDCASLFLNSCGRPSTVASYVRNLISHCQLPLSSHVPSSPAYATVRGKPRSEERRPDASPSMNPSGPSSGVTLHESDLHTGASDTTQYAAFGIQDRREMLSKVGASLALCGGGPSVPSYLGDDPIKEPYTKIYERPSYPDVCELLSVESASDEKHDSSNSHESVESEFQLLGELSSELVEFQQNCDVMNECCPEKSRDLMFVHCSGDVSDIKYSEENNFGNSLVDRMCNGIVKCYVSVSECEDSARKVNVSDDIQNTDQSNFPCDGTETNDFVYEGVKEKIKLFESCSSDVSCDSAGSDGLLSLRRKSLEKNKNSMIPSLKKFSVNEKQSSTLKSDDKNVKKEKIQPSKGNKSTKTTVVVANGFQNFSPAKASSDPYDLPHSSRVNDENLSSHLDYKCLGDFCPEVEVINDSAAEVNGELAGRCKSEELFPPLGLAFKAPKVQASRSKLQNRRHSATDTNLCYEDGCTANTLTSSSAATLDEVRGQPESGALQSRCASLPLVIGQVRENCARRNYPMRDASRAKSRIPRTRRVNGSVYSPCGAGVLFVRDLPFPRYTEVEVTAQAFPRAQMRRSFPRQGIALILTRWLNGYVNKQNCRIWSEANPQVYVKTPLHPEKLTVWCVLWAIWKTTSKTMKAIYVTVNGEKSHENLDIPELNNHDVQKLWFQPRNQHVTQLVPQDYSLKKTLSPPNTRFGP
ncbi:uncharacterized protein TNCV_2207951 [Trichonephila clavipes]|uniref:Uncharacterized protein n=1 Tax=Trichonephila clavipes TaxID=2585209 RepID=A0A8X6VFC8_TRICX|nr:uncharacterized protein TNCV_2207951 [Trichonephila clavipes]